MGFDKEREAAWERGQHGGSIQISDPVLQRLLEQALGLDLVSVRIEEVHPPWGNSRAWRVFCSCPSWPLVDEGDIPPDLSLAADVEYAGPDGFPSSYRYSLSTPTGGTINWDVTPRPQTADGTV